MYDELIKQLRNSCRDCKLWDGYDCCLDGDCARRYKLQAVNIIEELSASVEGFKSTTNMVFEETEGRTVIKFEPKWIPVTERLPETGVDVLVMFPHNMAVASRDMGEWVVNSGDGWCTDVNLSDDEKEPTHWMPLPDPPKEE